MTLLLTWPLGMQVICRCCLRGSSPQAIYAAAVLLILAGVAACGRCCPALQPTVEHVAPWRARCVIKIGWSVCALLLEAADTVAVCSALRNATPVILAV
jgi:hypothetical protein